MQLASGSGCSSSRRPEKGHGHGHGPDLHPSSASSPGRSASWWIDRAGGVSTQADTKRWGLNTPALHPISLRQPRPALRPPRHRSGRTPARVKRAAEGRRQGADSIPWPAPTGRRCRDGTPLALGFGPAVAIVHDHENPLPRCLPWQGQGNRAAVPGVVARVERLNPSLGTTVAEGEPTRSQGDQGLTLSHRRALARSSWRPAASPSTTGIFREPRISRKRGRGSPATVLGRPSRSRATTRAAGC